MAIQNGGGGLWWGVGCGGWWGVWDGWCRVWDAWCGVWWCGVWGGCGVGGVGVGGWVFGGGGGVMSFCGSIAIKQYGGHTFLFKFPLCSHNVQSNRQLLKSLIVFYWVVIIIPIGEEMLELLRLLVIALIITTSPNFGLWEVQLYLLNGSVMYYSVHPNELQPWWWK